LHRTVVTRRELKLFRSVDNDKCQYILFYCWLSRTYLYWLQGNCKTLFTNYIMVQSFPRYCSNTLDKKSAFYDLPVRRRLHLLIILFKKYISSSKHIQKELSIDKLVNKLTTQWKLENVLWCNVTYLNSNSIDIIT